MGCTCGKDHQVSEKKISYNITVKTSDAYCHSGTDSSVHVELLGQNGNESTGFLRLRHILKHDFEKGQKEHFSITAKDVGLPIILRIKLENLHKDDEWFCEYVTITICENGDKATFPIYDWVVNGIEVVRGEGVLPQKESNRYIKALREREVEENLSLYEWVQTPTPEDIGWGFPRYVNANKYQELPPLFKRTAIREKDVEGNRFSAAVEAALSFVKARISPVKSLDTYHRFADACHLQQQTPNFLDDWDTDEGMGRQVLTGISPLMVSRCTSLPDYFNVTNDDVCKFLSGNRTLEEEMEAGKIYISDYKAALGGVERNVVKGKELYCPDAVGLFHVNDEDKFLPIAIQLVPGDRDYLFTPENNNRWLLAKMYFRCAGTSEHEWVYHFLLTHNIVEPFAVALFRCLSRAHPVYKLLRPHLQTVSAINTDARTQLIEPNSLANQAIAVSATALSRKAFETFTLEDLVIPKRLKKQGIDEPNLLPNNYYRDDALALWKIMEKFVGSLLRYYYKSDTDICEDYELQNWAEDVAKRGLAWQDGNTRGMPTEIVTIDELIEICVTLMFSSSAQHAAVNFGQFETYKFAPNCPSNMRLPPPKKDDEVSDELVLRSLPSADSSIKVVALTYALSAFSPNEVYLGHYPDRLFCEQDVLTMMEQYREDLSAESDRIRKRNEGLHHPYTFLLPDRVPNSIAI
ncbi:allene oxide synthase-lipoxygenase protein-like isoform X1 [Clavelina lepadiformis]|uniref:allene oxide synthase-lipoxygenase protein-like isoform X1 n=1 Tax=Clavelina lepadiformis TaxID=159417 RepID=UPI0040414D87